MSETNLQDADLDRQLRERDKYTSSGNNPPPALRLAEIARRFNISVEAVKTMAEHLGPAK